MKSFRIKIRMFFVFLNLIFIFSLNGQTVVQWYTSMGDFRVQLREDLVPVTAQNFIDLTNAEFYDGLIFHRVIAEFMIQDGDPNGNGTGGPGYTFDDEFHPDLRHDQPGILSMANSGPNTNGSQYFITVVPTAWLDDVHAVFGKVMDGMEVVYAISEVETNANDKPLVDVVIDSIRVVTGDPTIELTAPLDYNKWNNKIVNNITWNSSFIADVKIEFSYDNGQNWEIITDAYSAHYRHFEWELPNIVSEECFIRISDAAHPEVVSMNEEPFTICSLDLTFPNGFDLFMNDIPVTITWTQDLVNDVLDIDYQLEENGDYYNIAQGVPAEDLSYIWYPDFASDWCKIRIGINNYGLVYDISDFRFFVYGLDLMSPQGGENLEGNSVYQIDWDAEVISNIKIHFSSDNGETWEILESNWNADNHPYEWTVPNIDASSCFIKISSVQASELFKANISSFSIHKAVAVNEYDIEGQIKIQPNPASDFLVLQLGKHQSTNMEVKILDISGRMVFRQDFIVIADQIITLDIEKLEKGIYTLLLSFDKDIISSKVIVE